MKTKLLLTQTAIVLAIVLVFSFESCKQDNNNDDDMNTAPTAVFTVDPASGTTATVFSFDASGSHDNEDPENQLQVRWDFNGNGSWDTDWSNGKTINRQYAAEGTYTVKMEVKDTEGLTGHVTHDVTVTNGGGNGIPCPGIPTLEYEGQTYNTVLIGDQCWLKENLNYETGTSWCYANFAGHCETYGRLYDYETALTACPPGWHLPTDDEWCVLTTFIDQTVDCDILGNTGTDIGIKLRMSSGWLPGNGSNIYGFGALPGGRYMNEMFDGMMGAALFWTATENDQDNVWTWQILGDWDSIFRSYFDKASGQSVRCVKD